MVKHYLKIKTQTEKADLALLLNVREHRKHKNKPLKKRTMKFTAFFFLITWVSCLSAMGQSTWQTKPVTIDGNPTEWSLPLRFSDSKSGLQYTITNDESNIYIAIRATEQQIQMKIVGAGMQIWINPDGKFRKTACIQFPLPGKPDPKFMNEKMQADIQQGKKPVNMNMANQFQMHKPEIIFSGFLPEYNGTFNTDETKGIKAAINWDSDNNMTYELSVPLKSIYQKDIQSLKENPVAGIMIVIDAEDFANKPQGGHSGGAAGGPPGGGDMQGGPPGGGEMGGMPAGGPPGGMASNPMSETTTIKVKVQLSGLVSKNN
jgi:hypothetical protein